MKPWRCRVGLHRWVDLQRRNEYLGRDATEECVACGRSRSVFRLFWCKDGPLHPRVGAPKP